METLLDSFKYLDIWEFMFMSREQTIAGLVQTSIFYVVLPSHKFKHFKTALPAKIWIIFVFEGQK